MMVGIRRAIKELHPLNYKIDICDENFSNKCMFDLSTKRNLNFDIRKTCVFYDYAPIIFEKIRFINGLSND